jgi:hypothetical protein
LADESGEVIAAPEAGVSDRRSIDGSALKPHYRESREANPLISLSLREMAGVRETGRGASAFMLRGGTSAMTG